MSSTNDGKLLENQELLESVWMGSARLSPNYPRTPIRYTHTYVMHIHISLHMHIVCTTT